MKSIVLAIAILGIASATVTAFADEKQAKKPTV